MRRRLAALALGAVAITGCTPTATDALPDTTPTPTASQEQVTPPRRSDPAACPTGAGGGGGASRKVSYEPVSARLAPRAAPDKDRPVVRLCFDVSADRRLIRGMETVTFTPDLRTCEVVFRAWPNKPETARYGNRLEVTAVALDGSMVTPKVESAGAPPGVPGTLIRVPVEDCLEPGEQVTVALAFTVTLGALTPERVGYSPDDLVAWAGTAYPLLAWERGRGWATEPAVDLFGETVTSEVFRLELLEIVAPQGDAVLGTGEALGTEPASRPGSVVHRFRADAVRDVAFSVGRMQVTEREVDGVRVHVGAPAGSVATPGEWADATMTAVKELSASFGPFPYEDLWVTIVPGFTSGIEFPGAIQFGDIHPARYPSLAPHEVAHMWFYGLVGNNQARDPWLDEAFAEYAEVLVNDTVDELLQFPTPSAVRNRVGESMEWYAALRQPDLYASGVYRQGGQMLHRARREVGAARFDQLLRDYVDANAHRVVTDEDVVRAFEDEPRVVELLREYGAIRP